MSDKPTWGKVTERFLDELRHLSQDGVVKIDKHNGSRGFPRHGYRLELIGLDGEIYGEVMPTVCAAARRLIPFVKAKLRGKGF